MNLFKVTNRTGATRLRATTVNVGLAATVTAGTHPAPMIVLIDFPARTARETRYRVELEAWEARLLAASLLRIANVLEHPDDEGQI